MSKRDWFADLAPWVGFAFCAVFIALIAWYGMYSKGYQQANEDHQANSSRYNEAEKAYRECSKRASIEEALHCYREAEKATREDHRDEQDLNAQREMADWAEGMLVATCVIGAISIILTGVGIYYIRKTLKSNTDAVDMAMTANVIAEKIGQAQVRAYLSMLSGKASVDNGGLRVTFDLANSGNSPATHIEMRSEYEVSHHTSVTNVGLSLIPKELYGNPIPLEWPIAAQSQRTAERFGIKGAEIRNGQNMVVIKLWLQFDYRTVFGKADPIQYVGYVGWGAIVEDRLGQLSNFRESALAFYECQTDQDIDQ